MTTLRIPENQKINEYMFKMKKITIPFYSNKNMIDLKKVVWKVYN